MYELELKQGDAITFYYLETSSKKRHGFFIGYTEKLKNVKDADCVIVYDINNSNSASHESLNHMSTNSSYAKNCYSFL